MIVIISFTSEWFFLISENGGSGGGQFKNRDALLYNREKQRWCMKILSAFSFYYTKYMYGLSERGLKMAELAHSGAKVWICGETSSAFLLHSLLSQDRYRATSRHWIILVSPRFSILSTRAQGQRSEWCDV